MIVHIRSSTKIFRVATNPSARYFSTSFPLKTLSTPTGYQSMGSFHSEDVEVMLRLAEDSYVAPPSPLPPWFLDSQQQMIADAAHMPLGSAFGQRHFLLDGNWTFINHGAFGAASRVGFNEANQWREYCELQPLRFFDRDLLPHLAHSCYTLARFINARPTDVALLPNATTGLNTVMRGVLENGDTTLTRRIFLFETAYGAVKKMANDIAARNPGVIVDIAPLPVSKLSHLTAEDAKQFIVDTADKYMSYGTSLAVFDHTTSNTAINMPLTSLASIARDKGAKVLVDGAHGLLAQTAPSSPNPCDMATLSEAGVDFYVANCHKWFASPKAAALLWSRSGECQQQCRPLVVSHGLGQGLYN
jgi:isopenicillin-N epimerase